MSTSEREEISVSGQRKLAYGVEGYGSWTKADAETIPYQRVLSEEKRKRKEREVEWAPFAVIREGRAKGG